MNTFLQVWSSFDIDDNNIIESMSELIQVWWWQPLSFRIKKEWLMMSEDSENPSEIAFYKLEKKHIVFNWLALELATVFNKIYNHLDTEVESVSLSLKYLVKWQGWNPIHIDAFDDTLTKDEYIYTNQQFSLFLSSSEDEEFVVFWKDSQKTIQKNIGSIMWFNPTQKHHHPDWHGSWILIIETILKTKI
jgi:hypothetical protein